MKYFILINSTNAQEVGSAFPQAQAINDGDFAYPGLSNYRSQIIPTEKQLPTFQLATKAKKTDLITSVNVSVPSNMLISSKLMHLLQEYSFPNRQYLSVKLLDKAGLAMDYYLLHNHTIENNFIDFNNSVFERTEHDFTVTPIKTEKSLFQVKDSIELQHEVESKKGSVRVKSLHFNEEVITQDSFVISQPYCWIVNQPLAIRLKEENISGIVLLPISPGEDFTEIDIRIKASQLES